MDRDDAERRFRAALGLRPLDPEQDNEIVQLASALTRVLDVEVVAPAEADGSGGEWSRPGVRGSG